MVGSLVAVAARLDPAALVSTGRVVGVVDHWAARVGFELPVDDHGASNRDGHARRKGQIVVDLNHDTLAQVNAEALVGAVRAVAVRKQDNHQALNGHLRRAAVVQGGDEALVVRPDGVAARERCRENAADQHQLAGLLAATIDVPSRCCAEALCGAGMPLSRSPPPGRGDDLGDHACTGTSEASLSDDRRARECASPPQRWERPTGRTPYLTPGSATRA
jgi:hypothetical protein